MSPSDALTGGFAHAAVESAVAFRAVLEAMSRPGRTETLTGAAPPAPLSPAAGAVLLVLADPDTPVHLAGAHDTEALRSWIAFHTDAPLAGADRAVFAVGTWEALLPVARFCQGDALYPDRSATLLVETPALSPANARLTGPGVDGTAEMRVPDIGVMARNALQYPMGLDFIFCAESRICALPRSTTVEAL